MKQVITIFFLGVTLFCTSQKKVMKNFQINNEDINIYTGGLDHLQLENSDKDFVEVTLIAERYDNQLIKLDHKAKSINISFEFTGTETREVIFRKFITKRLQRAYAIVKIPSKNNVTIFGENVDITSKNCNNKLEIYIDNGIVKLNTIKENTLVKLYAGNVYLSSNNTKVVVNSNMGIIKVDGVLYKEKYTTKFKNVSSAVEIKTVRGNVFIEN